MPLDIPDPIAALIQWLLADSDVSTAVSNRVYGPELPEQETKNQPRAALVIKSGAGQMLPRGCARLGDPIIEAWAYGASTGEINTISLLVYQKLKFELVRQEINNTLLHSAVPINQPVSFRDPNTNTPARMQSFQLLAAETATP